MIIIRKSYTTAGAQRRNAGPGRIRHILKAPGIARSSHIAIKQLGLRVNRVDVILINDGVKMPVSHEDIRPAVMIEIDESDSPAHQVWVGAEPGRERHITEGTIAVVVIKIGRVVGEVRLGDIEVSIVVAVRNGNPHSSLSFTVAAVRHTCHKCLVRERAVVIIVVKDARSGITGHVKIRPAVVVIINAGCTQSIVFVRQENNSCLLADIGKRPVAVVVIEKISPCGEPAWSACHRNTFILAELPRAGLRKQVKVPPLVDVVCNEQVKASIAIIVNKDASRVPAPRIASDPCSFGQFGKGTIPVVMVKQILSVTGHEEIVPSIAVIITYAHALTPTRMRQSGSGGDVGESSIPVVVKQLVGRRAPRWEACINRGPVNQEKIGETVAIVINPCHAATGGLEQIPFAFGSSKGVTKVQVRLLADIDVIGGSRSITCISVPALRRAIPRQRLPGKCPREQAQKPTTVHLQNLTTYRKSPHWSFLLLFAPMIIAACSAFASRSRGANAIAYLGSGLRLYELQRYGEAANQFALALKLDPSLPDARYHLAVCYFEQRRFASARQQFQKLAPTRYRVRWVTYYLGRLDLENGQLDNAISRFESLAGSEPLRDELYYLGSALLKKGDARKASIFLRREIDFNPLDFRAHYLLGRAELKLGQRGAAAAEFQESARIHQHYLRGKQDLTACREQLQAGEITSARRRCDSVLATNDVDKLVAVGTLFGEFRDYAYALKLLQRALELDPESPQINYDIAYTYYGSANYVKAADYSQKSLLRRPDFFEALEVYGMALHQLGRNRDARNALERAHELRPADPTVARVLNQLMATSGR